MTTDTCYHDGDECAGAVWACSTCNQKFCLFHSHVTELGNNVECPACERDRRDTKLLTARSPVARLLPRTDVTDRLDVRDK